MNELLQKDKDFLWTPESQKSFDNLKQRFITEPVLSMPDPEKPFQIEADASKYASGAVLSQKDEEEKRHPCAFISQSFSPAEQNYVIEERELLAILRALREWRHYIIGGKYPTTVLTDHKNLEKWSRGRQMKDRLRRWYLELSGYNQDTKYIPGAKMTQADALSRRPDYVIKSDDPEEIVMIPESLIIRIIDTELQDDIGEESNLDESVEDIAKVL